MAVYSITGGGVGYQDIDAETPDFDYVEHLRRLGYPDRHIRSHLRRQGYDDAEITRVLSRPTEYRPIEDRFAGGLFGSSEAATRPPPGVTSPLFGSASTVERSAMRTLTGRVPTATAEDYKAFVDRVAGGQKAPEFEAEYLGGYPSDFVYRTMLEAPNPQSLFGSRYGEEALTPKFSRPTYRQGAAYSYLSRIGPSKIREWQAFFAGLGFETGPSGVLNQHEIRNMQAFMGMANGIPNMKIDMLRDQVMDQVRQGIYFFRGVNESGDLLPLLLDEEAAGDLTTGGGGAPGSMGTEPITQTLTRTINEEISAEQGMLALRRVFQQQVGRMPNEEEIKELVRRVNAAFRADPTVITQVTTFDPISQEETTETTEDLSDVSVEGEATEFATQDTEERKQHLTNQYVNAIAAELGL